MAESYKLKAGTFLKIEFKKARDKQIADLKCFTEILFDPKTLRVEKDKHDDFRALIGRVAHNVEIGQVSQLLLKRFDAQFVVAVPFTEDSVYGKGRGQELSLQFSK
jgi:hypothetical protein